MPDQASRQRENHARVPKAQASARCLLGAGEKQAHPVLGYFRVSWGLCPPNPRHLPLWTNGMKKAPGLPLGASGRAPRRGTAALEKRALPASTPSAVPARRDWRKAKNTRGPPTASPIVACCRSQSIRKPDEPQNGEFGLRWFPFLGVSEDQSRLTPFGFFLEHSATM